MEHQQRTPVELMRSVSSGDLFAIVWRSYAYGATLIFVSFLAPVVLVLLLVEPSEALPALSSLIVIPVVVTLQGFVFGLIGRVGRATYLRVWRDK